jgi:flagellar protein FlaJ
MKRIPFVPFPIEKASRMSKSFLWLSSRMVRFNPFLAQNLSQAGIEMNDREYLSLTIFSSVFWFLLIFSTINFLGVALGRNLIGMSTIFAFLMSGVTYFYISLYPTLIISKRNGEIEKNLLFAIRHLYIQVKSGVSLFDGMVSISKSNYGILSEEFAKCTKEIATGKEEITALEEMAFNNPNLGLKRIIWQIVNSMRAGGDIGNTLDTMSKDLSDEQKVKIRKYGSQLSPMALMYLMLTVVLPTLGITFLIIFSTFSGIEISQDIFYIILFVLTVFQFMFIGLVKSRRPSVEV